MNYEKLRKKVLNKIASNDLEEAIELIITSVLSPDIREKMILIKRRLSELEGKKVTGTISSENESVARAKISSNVIQFLDALNSKQPEITQFDIIKEKALLKKKEEKRQLLIKRLYYPDNSEAIELCNIKIAELFAEIKNQSEILVKEVGIELRFWGFENYTPRDKMAISWKNGTYRFDWAVRFRNSLRDSKLTIIQYDKPFDPFKANSFFFQDEKPILVKKEIFEFTYDSNMEIVLKSNTGNYYSIEGLTNYYLNSIIEKY